MKRACAIVISVCAICAQLHAQPVVITSSTTVGPLDTTITGVAGVPVPLATAEITVQGTTLTVNGRHQIQSLDVVAGGIVTHDQLASFDYAGDGTDVVNGLFLTVNGDLAVDANGSIDVASRGFLAFQGPGAAVPGATLPGGSYGGRGGANDPVGPFPNGGYGETGDPYGSITEPIDFGSGGRNGAGGGAIRLNVHGAARIDGVLSADGQSANAAGAGGSIWLTCSELTGGGIVRANGGQNLPGACAGTGGGGRIAMYADTAVNWSGDIVAQSFDNLCGTGGDGGAGTLFIKLDIADAGTLIIDNRGEVDLPPQVPVGETVLPSGLIVPNMIIRGGARAAPPFPDDPAAATQWVITVTGDLTVESSSELEALGKGFPAIQGPGAASGDGIGGGSHGGIGASNDPIRDGPGAGYGAPAPSYGSFEQPTTLGSGGRSARGGGAMLIQVGGVLHVDGVIAANGAIGQGSGAGGSLWVECSELVGQGQLQANGGMPPPQGCGGTGGGGRLAVYAGDSSRWFGQLSAQSFTNLCGQGGEGGAGTIYYRASAAEAPDLIIDNGGISDVGGTNLYPTRGTPLIGEVVLPGNLIVSGNGRLTHSQRSLSASGQESLLRLMVAGDVIIQTGGAIDLEGRGYGDGFGPLGQYDIVTQQPTLGLGLDAVSGGPGGGGYGGNGSVGTPDALLGGVGRGGSKYGSSIEPVTMGSPGGRALSGAEGTGKGMPGGGYIRMDVVGDVSIASECKITADGGGFENISSGIGGGAGGGILIYCNRLIGNGVVSANGGPGAPGPAPTLPSSGGGGGGRIAIYSSFVAEELLITASGAPVVFNQWNATVAAEDGSVGIFTPDNGFCPVDADGDGRIDIEDLYFVHQNPVDSNGDGVVDVEDRRCLERYLRFNEIEDMTNGRR